MKPTEAYDREAAFKDYQKRKVFSEKLQPLLDENFSNARSEKELLEADGKTIRKFLNAHRQKITP